MSGRRDEERSGRPPQRNKQATDAVMPSQRIAPRSVSGFEIAAAR